MIVVSQITFSLVVLVMCIALGALIVQLVTTMATGSKPSVGISIRAVIVTIVAGVSVIYVLQETLGSLGSLIGLVVAFLAGAFIINLIVKQPGGDQMRFGKASLVSLALITFYVVLSVVVFFLVGGALLAFRNNGAH